MTGGALGGGVIFVVAALLWAAVLVPAWVRRREFRVAERNAMRLQRTLRVLAETSEIPEEVRVEATAKEALAREKMLRTAQKRQDAERAAELAEERAEQVKAELRAQQMNRKQVATMRSARLRRPLARRVRAFAALAGVLGLGGLLVGAGIAISGLGAAVLLWSMLAFSAGIATLVLLAPGRVKVPEIPAERAVVGDGPVEPRWVSEATETAVTTQGSAVHAASQQAAAERIARARAMARARAEKPAARVNQVDSMLLAEARARKAESARTPKTEAAPTQTGSAQTSPAKTAVAQASAAQRSQELTAAAKLRQMGVVGDTSEGMPDLDAVLKRRRNVG